MPELAHSVRPDVIMATGRSDYPTKSIMPCASLISSRQPDVGATAVNEEMKVACVRAIAAMAHVEATPVGNVKNTDKCAVLAAIT